MWPKSGRKLVRLLTSVCCRTTMFLAFGVREVHFSTGLAP